MARTSRSAKVTTDHETIKHWVEERGGWPASVKGTEQGKEEAGLPQIDFPGYSGADRLDPIDWDDFFDKFEESNLAFLYQEQEDSRFNNLVDRDGVEVED